MLSNETRRVIYAFLMFCIPMDFVLSIQYFLDGSIVKSATLAILGFGTAIFVFATKYRL